MGLYVYGALLIALSFVVGLSAHDPLLMALALSACGSAALAELANAVASSPWGMGYWYSGHKWVNVLAVASWLLAAGAAIYAVLSLIGGA